MLIWEIDMYERGREIERDRQTDKEKRVIDKTDEVKKSDK